VRFATLSTPYGIRLHEVGALRLPLSSTLRELVTHATQERRNDYQPNDHPYPGAENGGQDHQNQQATKKPGLEKPPDYENPEEIVHRKACRFISLCETGPGTFVFSRSMPFFPVTIVSLRLHLRHLIRSHITIPN
jgi:hypothetical protein